ncbi:mannan endo-1,4-beta-mannosidase [Chytriomyces confervae]|uniref:Mannan endo-1,4-beta-mannosidase n=1 Tax=Chytriomyces confervae TaxID=246404 RepID=A0A507F3V6_9FUNG|nr:hypothetical protein HDU80_010970 [Chytriomyces hyalinus]TPX70277.1 mannan endo-1,4-beta-mannosidase [Chytriomyces confervae]
MGAHTRNNILYCLFWLKATFALALSLTGLFYLSWRVYDLHTKASNPSGSDSPNILQPVTIVDPGTGKVAESCMYTDTTFARLEPQFTGKMMPGFHLDWSYETPTVMKKKLNDFTPAVFNTFMDLIPGTFSHGFNEDLLNWFGSECGRTGSMLELTMQVGATLDTVTQDMYDALATSITKINTGYGVPVYLRFCHEMNGDWTMYGYQPTLFKAGFRKMAEAIRARTNMTAMVWGPNVGITYPFSGGGSVLLPRKGTPDFIAMDTNKDGEITNLDDPYSPYYPGDDVVDWVGVSLYNYPLDNCYNCRVLPTYFADYLTGEGAALEGVTTVTPAYTEVHNFYQKYCAGAPNKPMMLPESGSPFITERVARANAQSVSESELKMQWWEQLVSAENLAKFPKFKLAVQFEEAKMMSPTGVPELFNWKVTNTTQVLSAFNALLDRSASTIVSAGKLKFGCDGSVKQVKP